MIMMDKSKRKRANRRHYNVYLKMIEEHVGFKSLELMRVTKTFLLSESAMFNLRQAVKDEVLKDIDHFKNYTDDMPSIPLVFDDCRCEFVGKIKEDVKETKKCFHVKMTIPAIVLKCKVGKLLHGEVRQVFTNSIKVRIADLFHCTVSLKNRKDRFSNYEIEPGMGVCFRVTSMGVGTGVEDYPEFKGTFKCASKAYTLSMEGEQSEDEASMYTTEDSKVTSDASTVLSEGASKKVKLRVRTRPNNTPSNNHTTTDEEEKTKRREPAKKKPAEPVSKEYSAMLDGVLDSVMHKIHIEAGISEDDSEPTLNQASVKEHKGATTDENSNHVVDITKTKLKQHKMESDSHCPSSSQKSDEDFQVKHKKKRKKERREKAEGHVEASSSVDEWVNTSQKVAPENKIKHTKSNQLSTTVSLLEQEQKLEDPTVTKKKKKKKHKKKLEVDTTLNTTADTSMNDSQAMMETTISSVNEVNGEVEPTKKKKKKKNKSLNETEVLPADDTTVNQGTENSTKKKKKKRKHEEIAVANETMNEVPLKKKKKKNKKHENEA